MARLADAVKGQTERRPLPGWSADTARAGWLVLELGGPLMLAVAAHPDGRWGVSGMSIGGHELGGLVAAQFRAEDYGRAMVGRIVGVLGGVCSWPE